MLKKIKSGSFSKILMVFPLLHLVLSSNGKTEKRVPYSINGMVNLLEIETQLIDSVENYATELQMKVDALKDLVSELKEENQKSTNKREEYLFNPLNGFSLIRRQYNDWPKIERFMTRDVGEEYLSILQKYRSEMPTLTDLMEASAAIYRLQTVYGLEVDDLVRGILNGKQYDAKLKSIDSYFMGYCLFSKELYHEAGLWLNSSINNFEIENSFYQIVKFVKGQPLELYAEALVSQYRFKEALKFITLSSDMRPFDHYALNRKNEIQFLVNTNNDEPLEMPELEISNYELGCRGHFANRTSKNVCVYNTTTTPFLRLAPLKMEIINLDPYMVLFHDVLSDKEIEHLQNLAGPNLRSAEVYSYDLHKMVVVDHRTSQVFWFEDHSDDIVKRINKRIIDMTGFDIVDSEELEIGNYGMGGHYEQHYDFFDMPEDESLVDKQGDRIATVLFYLSDVEQGGATVFNNMEIAVTPRKGSALFWYNLNNKLEADIRTLHTACPVIVGSKWVANKWIRAKNQMFRKPCYK